MLSPQTSGCYTHKWFKNLSDLWQGRGQTLRLKRQLSFPNLFFEGHRRLGPQLIQPPPLRSSPNRPEYRIWIGLVRSKSGSGRNASIRATYRSWVSDRRTPRPHRFHSGEKRLCPIASLARQSTRYPHISGNQGCVSNCEHYVKITIKLSRDNKKTNFVISISQENKVNLITFVMLKQLFN